MEQYLISVDDTDDVTKEISTGRIAEMIGDRLCDESGVIMDGISRHQLLLSDEISYTSHNSSMCFEIEYKKGARQEIMLICENIIRDHMAGASDPGLAVCSLNELNDRDAKRIIDYGFSAKREVKTKKDAYDLASSVNALSLKELGGSGIGIIGALAGIGLRLSRSDGSLRGKAGKEFSGVRMHAKDICFRFGAEMVVCGDGSIVPETEYVRIDKFIKLMYFDGHKCCIARKENGEFITVSQHRERERFSELSGRALCADFVSDNDEEEMVIPQGEHSCFNCLYRRWIQGGFRCMKYKAGTDGGQHV